MYIRINNKGQSVLEVIVALAIFSLIASAMVSMAIGGFIGLNRGGEHLEAESLAQEGLEAVYSIKDRAWNSMAFTTSSVSTSSEFWVFDGEGTTEIIGDYTRTISFSDVCRDVSDDIVDCPGIYTDPHTKKVHVQVSWDVGADEPSVVEKTSYLSNWDTIYWPQSDWIGGSGQSFWSDITKYDSDDGGVVVSTAGEVYLDQTFSTSGSSTWPFDVAGNYTYSTSSIEVSGGLAFLTDAGGAGSGGTLDDGFEYTYDTSNDWPFTTSSNYIFNASDIEVAGGVAQLKQSSGGSCSGVATACNTYGAEGSCSAQGGCLWGGGASGATTNANFSTALTPWTSGTWATIAPTLSRSATGGNPTGYAKIQFPNTKSRTSGGYFQQSFIVTSAASIATLNLDWIVSQYTGTADSLHLYAFVDTVAGTPTIGGAGQVWDSGNRTGVSAWASTGSINVASKIIGAGTYYLKIVTYVDYKNGGANRQYATGFDNVQLSWTGAGSCSGTATACGIYDVEGSCSAQGGCSWVGGSYPTSTPAIYPSSSYSGSGVQAWTSFTETATKNGGQIYYQLSYDDGISWYYWNSVVWSIAGVSNYNTASVINTNISNFTTSTEQIKFKAFLSSDGSQLVQLDNINIGLTPPSAVWSFSDWGVGGGEVTPTGQIQSSGGNPNSYSEITVPAGNNDEVGGYFEQSFVTTNNNPSGTLDFDYKSIDFNGTPNISEIRIYVDTATGDPVNQVGSSVTLSAEGDWTSATQIDIASAITTAGTYYLKIAYWIDTPAGSTGPFTVGFDNVDLNWSAGSYPTDEPSIYNSTSLVLSAISSWTGFLETATKNGGEIYYQLSDDDGSSWKYWTGASWETATLGTDYNTATQVNSYINQFPVDNKRLMFKAFLVSDGSQFISLDSLEVSYDVTTPGYNGNQFAIDSTTGIGVMSKTTDVTSLKFSAKNTKFSDSIRVYLEQENGTSPSYRYGIQADSAGEPSGTWLGGTNQGYGDYSAAVVGWNTISLNEAVNLTAGETYHMVIEYESGTINGANSIELRASSPNNFLHPFDGSVNAQSNVLFSEDSGSIWSIGGYQPIYVLGFTDLSFEGNPYHEVQEHQIYGDNYFGEELILTYDAIVSEIGALVSENNEGPEDNLYLTVYDVGDGVELANGSLAQDVDLTNNVYSWEKFAFDSPINLIAGNTYRIYLSSPSTTVQQHYLVRSIYHDNNSVLNSLDYLGINGFTISSAFASSSWTNNVGYDLGGFRFSTTLFNASAYLISSAYNTTASSSFSVIEWDQVSPTCSPACVAKLQIQTAPDNSGVPGTWSETWCGPEGENGDETDYYTVNTGELIHTDHNGDQWIRYKAFLEGDTTNSPTLEETRVYYKNYDN